MRFFSHFCLFYWASDDATAAAPAVTTGGGRFLLPLGLLRWRERLLVLQSGQMGAFRWINCWQAWQVFMGGCCSGGCWWCWWDWGLRRRPSGPTGGRSRSGTAGWIKGKPRIMSGPWFASCHDHYLTRERERETFKRSIKTHGRTMERNCAQKK